MRFFFDVTHRFVPSPTFSFLTHLALCPPPPRPPSLSPKQEAEANRVQQLNERAGKAKRFVQRVDSVAEKNESRKVSWLDELHVVPGPLYVRI